MRQKEDRLFCSVLSYRSQLKHTMNNFVHLHPFYIGTSQQERNKISVIPLSLLRQTSCFLVDNDHSAKCDSSGKRGRQLCFLELSQWDVTTVQQPQQVKENGHEGRLSIRTRVQRFDFDVYKSTTSQDL